MTDLHPFVRSLYGLAEREDRAALAKLRRSLVQPLAAMPYVAPYLRREATANEERAYSLVAGLFAIHPTAGHQTLAVALRMLSDRSDSVALRFRALLDAASDDVGDHLRHAVSLVRGADIAIDFNDLFWTVLTWNREDQRAQRAWARQFWAATEAPDTLNTENAK